MIIHVIDICHLPKNVFEAAGKQRPWNLTNIIQMWNKTCVNKGY